MTGCVVVSFWSLQCPFPLCHRVAVVAVSGRAGGVARPAFSPPCRQPIIHFPSTSRTRRPTQPRTPSSPLFVASTMSNGKDNPSFLKRIEDTLPQWIVAGLRSKQQWKALIRCWVATWAGFILILPENSLKTLGNA